MVRKKIIETKKVLKGGKTLKSLQFEKKQKENRANISAHS